MQSPPSPADGYFAYRDSALALCISLLILATIAVILRFVARARTKAALGLDDALIVVALFCFYGTVIVTIWQACSGGYGYSPLTLPLPLLELALKAYYINPILSVPAITFTKLSILCFFYRIFATKRFRLWVKVLGITCILWAVACLIAAIFRCIPIKATWDVLIKGRCYNFVLFFVIIEPINCLQDLIIVLMPLAMIRQLQLPLRHKVMLCFVFLLGGFVTITSITRIALTWNPRNQQTALLNSGKWLLVQLAFAIICACLPTYRPLFSQTNVFASHFSGWFTSLRSRTHRSTDPGPQDAGFPTPVRPHTTRYKNISDDADENINLTQVKAGKPASEEFPMNVINVQRTIDIV